jgi:hypothetical protein
LKLTRLAPAVFSLSLRERAARNYRGRHAPSQ